MRQEDEELVALRREWASLANDANATPNAGRRLKRARMSSWTTQVIEAGVALAALAFVALALMHAANWAEATLGVVVGAAICGVWIYRRLLGRDETRAVELPRAAYVGQLGTLRRKQARVADFIGMVVVLELIFLIPWWVIGSRVHSRRLGDVGSIITMWVPLAGMAAVLVWVVRARRSARREARTLEAAEPGDPADR